ncbi:uncharacterized protein MYCFIDRAFT_177094 [Pseudocercospora fijiensis CIRAD86]|uniref:Uncharacterized protein n=1 Tax=Pseudocercospora fijiensis (strain CIRAD86) TaxID=383855 RepID=M3ARP6_PSEFD|nr:uncharacterized protein MYCFIDRAFT_177094 [Pseudocercospora fijiensis CIRAD86]EME80117.1 hypothetical protein MYCFIDRAFT_177094 [Pseudocercospora fijiensis CIRAD86]
MWFHSHPGYPSKCKYTPSDLFHLHLALCCIPTDPYEQEQAEEAQPGGSRPSIFRVSAGFNNLWNAGHHGKSNEARAHFFVHISFLCDIPANFLCKRLPEPLTDDSLSF